MSRRDSARASSRFLFIFFFICVPGVNARNAISQRATTGRFRLAKEGRHGANGKSSSNERQRQRDTRVLTQRTGACARRLCLFTFFTHDSRKPQPDIIIRSVYDDRRRTTPRYAISDFEFRRFERSIRRVPSYRETPLAPPCFLLHLYAPRMHEILYIIITRNA